MPTAPGVWERFSCWANPGGLACYHAVQGRLYVDQQAADASAALAEHQAAAVAAQQGVNDAVGQASLSQVGWTLAMVLPPVVLVGLGIGAYLWYRSRTPPPDVYPEEEEW